MLVGIHTQMHEDSTLEIESFDDSTEMAWMPMTAGDTIVEVSERSCSWYNGMSLDEIVQHLQVSSPAWPNLSQSFLVLLRES